MNVFYFDRDTMPIIRGLRTIASYRICVFEEIPYLYNPYNQPRFQGCIVIVGY